MVPISTELFNVSLLKTVSPIIKTINSKTERASKYPHPYTKVMLDNTAKINTDSINAGLLFPLGVLRFPGFLLRRQECRGGPFPKWLQDGEEGRE